MYEQYSLTCSSDGGTQTKSTKFNPEWKSLAILCGCLSLMPAMWWMASAPHRENKHLKGENRKLSEVIVEKDRRVGCSLEYQAASQKFLTTGKSMDISKECR